MEGLPELPFERILSFLSLDDLIKSRRVSKTWRNQIDCFKVRRLCYSNRPTDFIIGKSRWISGTYAQNFVSSPRIESLTRFVNTFDQTLLSNLKNLRLWGVNVGVKESSAFCQALNSFGELVELGLFHFNSKFPMNGSVPMAYLKLNLPRLNSVDFECLEGIALTLDAPRLENVTKSYGLFDLDIVHTESVKKITLINLSSIDWKKLKNIEYLNVKELLYIDSTFLTRLEQLKEIHLSHRDQVFQIFEQKQRYGRDDLKIYLCGLPLNGPDDPALSYLVYFSDESTIAYLAENASRLAQISLRDYLDYSPIERAAPGTEIHFLSKFPDLSELYIKRTVQDTQRFLDTLKNFKNIKNLEFYGEQPQDMFDRLPEHCEVQRLVLTQSGAIDFRFLIRFKSLIYLDIKNSIDEETFRIVLKENPFLSRFNFQHKEMNVSIGIELPKRYTVSVGSVRKIFADLDTLFSFIFRNDKLGKVEDHMGIADYLPKF